MYHGERFNALTHLFGAVLALAGGVVLVALAAQQGDPWKITSVSIYGVTLVLLYTSSTLYHSFRGRAKRILQKLDHHSIYLLIAGSYTPFCLVTLRGPWGWSLFGVVWGLALLGILQEMRPTSPSLPSRGGDAGSPPRGSGFKAAVLGAARRTLRPRSEARLLSVVIYVVMGWVAVFALVPLLEVLGTAGFTWLAVGGLLYTLGIVFYALDGRLAHAHGIWHLFVIAGSTAHYLTILLYVL